MRLAIVGGATIVLPWVMLADYVGTKYMATFGLILVASPLNGPLSALSMIATGYLLNWGCRVGRPVIGISLRRRARPGRWRASTAATRVESKPGLISQPMLARGLLLG